MKIYDDKKFFFSIILATYNGSNFLLKQLNSIVNQSFIDWEIIIIDDCSSDKTIEIINNEKYKFNNIKVITNKINIGPSLSFFKAFDYVRGKWIVFCDQDDIWSRNKLKVLHSNVQLYKNYNGFLHNGKYISDIENCIGINMNPIVNGELIYKNEPNLKLNSLLKRNKVVGCMSIFNFKFLKEKIYIYPPNYIFHDYWISLLVATYSEIKFIKDPLIKYRRHQNNYSLKKRRSFFRKIIDRLIMIFYLILNHLLKKISNFSSY